ncbi:pyridoxal-dependent decarboxylase [Sphingomonas sp.]|uniref:pyridoxal phosphate-dependent decarboxylase family protein n=1 Tax=Sphingomonas sp. TaxID=28214 RepID=UPI000DB3FA10|nr:pyridoxal-dependent decarboxylase [Sphingomonas sp.]PZU11992.1 MAG: aspartate aminotransferase family protein [Sphingomonas sp.]
MGSETGWDAMGKAAEAAIAYRRAIAAAETTPTVGYGEMLAAFAAPLPDKGAEASAILEELVAKATPGIRASTAPRFYGWVIGNSHPTGVAADWLTAAWGQNAGNLLAAPAASAVEAVAAGWLLDLLGLPGDASMGFVTGATIANFVCLAAARSEVLRRAGWDVEADGLFGAPVINVLIGADAHATVFSGLKFLGLGAQRVTTIATDAAGRMRPDALAEALFVAKGPTIVIAQAGQINTGASDPFAEIVPLARAADAWLHVDGAFGLWAQASPSLRHLTAGVEGADSWATDGHKWLQTPYDCGYAIVRDTAAHQRAMAFSASYLPPAADSEREPSAFVPELSRRARGFATWAMIRQFGRSGIAEMVQRCCAVAGRIGERLEATPGITIVAPIELNQLLLRFGNDDAATLATIAQIQEDAVLFAGASSWRGEWVMRISVSSSATTLEDADITADAIAAAWEKVSARLS